jgi:hypothetical protein
LNSLEKIAIALTRAFFAASPRLRAISSRAASAMTSKPPRLTTCIEASRAEVAHAVSCELGEGALWHAELGVYLHVDIYGPSKLLSLIHISEPTRLM